MKTLDSKNIKIVRIKLESEPDYIYSHKFSFSLKKMMEFNPDGCSDATIANVLKITEEEVQSIYDLIVLKLKNILGA